MHELHENEQYFFDPSTIAHLAEFVARFDKPCCICAPTIGKALVERGIETRILDIDERFASLKGFRKYDLYRPEYLDEEFGIIVCDPPFFNLSLSQLFKGLRLLSHHRFDQPILISYLKRRENNLLGAFALFNLEPTGYFPGYQTVQKVERNQIEFYGNLGEELYRQLRGETI